MRVRVRRAIFWQIMGTVRINCVRTCAALLSLMFFYDIFWVFLSGYFFKQSVMIVVATGGKSGESLPMLFAVPHECGYSMLGLGAAPGRPRQPHRSLVFRQRSLLAYHTARAT